LIIEEPESNAMARDLDFARAAGHRMVPSVLLETELHRAGHRYGLDREMIDSEVSKLTIIAAADSTFRRAGAFTDPLLRSLDALHLATAIECGSAAIYTYDHRQAEAATNAGIVVLAPTGPHRS